MTTERGSITIDPEGATVVVDLVHLGTRPTVYADSTGGTTLSLPLELSAPTELWLPRRSNYGRTAYTVVVTLNDVEVLRQDVGITAQPSHDPHVRLSLDEFTTGEAAAALAGGGGGGGVSPETVYEALLPIGAIGDLDLWGVDSPALYDPANDGPLDGAWWRFEPDGTSSRFRVGYQGLSFAELDTGVGAGGRVGGFVFEAYSDDETQFASFFGDAIATTDGDPNDDDLTRGVGMSAGTDLGIGWYLLASAEKAIQEMTASPGQTDPLISLRDENGDLRVTLKATEDYGSVGIFGADDAGGQFSAGHSDADGGYGFLQQGTNDGIAFFDNYAGTVTTLTSAPLSDAKLADLNGIWGAAQGVVQTYLDQAGDKLKFRVLYADGTTFKTGEVALT